MLAVVSYVWQVDRNENIEARKQWQGQKSNESIICMA